LKPAWKLGCQKAGRLKVKIIVDRINRIYWIILFSPFPDGSEKD
jgi:hypothetical protein